MHKNPEGISPKFGIFTQNDLSDRLILLLNFIADKPFTNEAENSYIITLTYTVHQNWSIFAENQGFMRKSVPNDFQFGAGGAYLINKNMQADLSARIIFDERGDNTYIVGGGVSWRLDKHQDKIIVGEVDNDEINMPKEDKSFWDTITFGLFAGGKKSNNGQMRSVKSAKVKTRDIQAPVNKKAQKRERNKTKDWSKNKSKKKKLKKNTVRNQKTINFVG